MARKCIISGQAGQYGNRVSHAKNKTRHLFKSNLQVKRVYLAEEKKFIRVKVSTRVIRTLDKLGLNETLRKYGMTLAELTC